VNGNYLAGNELITNNNSLGVQGEVPDSVLLASAFNVAPVITHTAKVAYDLVLQSAGASLKRDMLDARIVKEVLEGNATYGIEGNGIIDSQNDVGGWPVLQSKVAPADSDKDGMPDAWEKEKGLNPNDKSDAALTTLHSSFTNIEMFLQELIRERP
jgi:hypothetical protein